jgi:hypothetical protein
MLYALRQPATLLGIVLGFAVGCYLRATLQHAVTGGLRSARQRTNAHLWLDPYGVVAALIGGAGWSPRPELSRFKRRQVWTVLAVALLVHAALAAAGLVAFLAVGGSHEAFAYVDSISVLHGTAYVQFLATDFSQKVALGFGIENLACGLLVLVPIPPLELGVALWSTLPKSASARQMAYRVLDEQWGVLIVLVLLVVPLAGEFPLLLKLVGSMSDRIVNAL